MLLSQSCFSLNRPKAVIFTLLGNREGQKHLSVSSLTFYQKNKKKKIEGDPDDLTQKKKKKAAISLEYKGESNFVKTHINRQKPMLCQRKQQQ